MDSERAKKLCKIDGLIMGVFIALGLVGAFTACLGISGERICGKDLSFLLVLGGKVNVGVTVVCFFSAITVGRLYWRHKEIAVYDEFGVRRDEKRRMEMAKEERRQLEFQSLMELEKVLPRNIIEKITHEGSKDPEKDLDALIGLRPIKDRVLEMKARMEFDEEERERLGRKKSQGMTRAGEGHHMVFYGSPGTGKTTIARIITGILWDYEYIQKNHCLEVDGNFLKSSDASSTEKKVRFICRAAYGGVLFIDEAYSLGGDTEGEMAIATLIKEMEDNRDKFVVILAGYKEPMSAMLDVNPGFKSRVKEYLDFPDYSDEEMFEIFAFLAKAKGFETDESLYFRFFDRLDAERSLSSWGNARTARNILEESIDKHALRCMRGEVPEEHRRVLEPSDISTEPKSLL